MTACVTPAVLRAAIARLDRYGLYQLGQYVDGAGQAACTLGHIALAAGVRVTKRLSMEDHDELLEGLDRVRQEAAAAFAAWPGSPGSVQVVSWSDYEASAADVRAFYCWWLARLEGAELAEPAPTQAQVVLVA